MRGDRGQPVDPARVLDWAMTAAFTPIDAVTIPAQSDPEFVEHSDPIGCVSLECVAVGGAVARSAAARVVGDDRALPGEQLDLVTHDARIDKVPGGEARRLGRLLRSGTRRS